MKLEKILKNVEVQTVYGNIDREIGYISVNSNDIKQKSLFISIKGFKKDGHDFVLEAIGNGAVAVVVQKKLDLPENITQVVVKNSRKQLPLIAANYYRHPSKKIRIIGVTGTNGKTTTCFLINSILRKAKIKSSLITTVQSYISDKPVKFDRTTPGPVELNNFFSQSVDMGIEFACMEVSSHSIDLHRIDFLDFAGFVFTNLSQDHLDYHRNMSNYFYAKKKLFMAGYRHLYGGKFAVINVDDEYGKKISAITDLERVSFSLNPKNSDIWAENIKNSIDGIEFDLVSKKSPEKLHIRSPLCGHFNVYNIMASIGTAFNFNLSSKAIKEGIESMKGVPGRFEKISCSKSINIIVDYAHTPDGLLNVLRTSKQLRRPGSRIITVFGCGGDRDKEKRKVMGSISDSYSDYTIITSDNPRTEDPDSIIEMIEAGFKGANRHKKRTDRKKAILEALEMAESGDIVLIAGKGHEDYQEFKDYRIHFSDQEIVREWDSCGKNKD